MTMERTPTGDSNSTNFDIATGLNVNDALPEFTEAQQMAWDVCDGVLDVDRFERLQTLLADSEEARQEYLSIISIHQSLLDIFNPGSLTQRLSFITN